MQNNAEYLEKYYKPGIPFRNALRKDYISANYNMNTVKNYNRP